MADEAFRKLLVRAALTQGAYDDVRYVLKESIAIIQETVDLQDDMDRTSAWHERLRTLRDALALIPPLPGGE